MSDNQKTSRKTIHFKYDWLKLVQGLDHKEFGNFKTIAFWIVDHMFGDSLICNPGIDTFVKVSGMPRRTAIDAINAGLKAGWIDKRKGGGTKADGSGISTAYCILIPCGLWHCTPISTVQKFRAYSAELAGQQCKKQWATVQPTALESSLESFFESKIQTTVGANAPERDREEERETVISPSIDPSDIISQEIVPSPATKSAADIDDARMGLPIATTAQRGLWGDAWPSENVAIDPMSDMAPVNTRRNRIIYDCLHVMGYAEDALAPTDSDTKFMDRWLRDRLSEAVIIEMEKRKQAGKLTALDIANVVASHNVGTNTQSETVRYEARA